MASEQVREIAASLDVQDESEHVVAVLAATRRFDGREISMADLPPGDHRVRDIETLESLARAMDGLNANVLAVLAYYGADFSFCDGAVVADCARLAAEDIKRRQQPPKRGAPSKTSREVLLCELATIYKKATGRAAKIVVTSYSGKTTAGQPTGHFFKFMRASVSPVPALKGLADHALHAAVKRATRTKRR